MAAMSVAFMRPSYTAGFRLRKQAEAGYKRRESDCNRIHAIGKARFEGCKVGLRCVVLALLDAGADVDAKDNSGRTVMYPRRFGDSERLRPEMKAICRMFREAGVKE